MGYADTLITLAAAGLFEGTCNCGTISVCSKPSSPAKVVWQSTLAGVKTN